MLDYIEQNGIKHGIDYLNKIIPNLQSKECEPQLVFSEWNENGKQIDSDIQNIYTAAKKLQQTYKKIWRTKKK